MHLVLWIVAGVLAAAFLVGGGVKVLLQKDELRAAGRIGDLDTAAWTEDFSGRSVGAIGVLEVTAAVALVLPPVLGVATVLVPVAAGGLGVLMIGAAVIHLRRDEHKVIVVNAFYLVLATTVAWGRVVAAPFPT